MIFFKESKMCFRIQILLVIFSIAGGQDIFEYSRMPNGSASSYELLRIHLPPQLTRVANYQFILSFYAMGKLITTNMRKVLDNPVVSSYTGIWTARSDPKAFHSVVYKPRPEILRDFGDIVFYQDQQKGSAITFYPDINEGYVMAGVLCENYSLSNVPRSYENKILSSWQFSSGHAIQRSLLDKDINVDYEIMNKSEASLYTITEIPHDPKEKLSEVFDLSDIKDSMVDNNRSKRQANPIPIVVYPKILVTLHGDDIWSYNIKVLVKYMVTYWNVVDMIYRKLMNPKVRLSLYGIIIPQDKDTTPYMTRPSSYINDSVSGDYVLVNMGKYFDDEKFRFPRDKYNIITAMTTNMLCNTLYGPPCDNLAGKAWSRSACNRIEMNSTFIYQSLAVVQFGFMYNGVFALAHELGHTLGAIDHDGSMTNATSNCSAKLGNIMTPFTNYRANLEWSSCSINLIRSYLQSNAASCLHKKPSTISSSLKNLPGTWLSLRGQCHNFYYDAHMNPSMCYIHNSVYPNRCNTLRCMISYKCVDPQVTPLDGSSCTILPQTEGYCLNGQCLPKP